MEPRPDTSRDDLSNHTHAQTQSGEKTLEPFFLFTVLLLIEAGYILWLQKLPVIEPTQQPLGVLEAWIEQPKVIDSLLLASVGGHLAWSGLGLVSLILHKRAGHTLEVHKNSVMNRLTTTVSWALVAGASLLLFSLTLWVEQVIHS